MLIGNNFGRDYFIQFLFGFFINFDVNRLQRGWIKIKLRTKLWICT